jgi:hypothetical protein
LALVGIPALWFFYGLWKTVQIVFYQ